MKMGNKLIISRFKKAYEALTGADNKKIPRCQCNLTIAYDVILGVKFLADVLKVPQYIVCEHIIELGSDLLLKSAKTPEQQQKLREHLVNVHLSNRKLKEDKNILILRQD